uniref:3'-5' exonuclease domain-containing protein n=1 Tax=Chromera velia CCMP2878 TaxID=1169474 RepID=A0A0G4GM29_9ALVE|eukprot:Cvel_22497.t1-p1 / transcript=Cvel_22497.t1 / gene=Cvel_22497 / organism=Chromera_velia_CCMP2878 / gene_product=Probable exonuclease mut-7 homolog, putative / transcript_product=Probable exonuclease mut-7 homolog, putative / location=Cvel_scaffold2217:11221-20575(-) / protein_length=1933 / sequence_SO=supercontig / SO=protein_coding / is_pseudo=false
MDSLQPMHFSSLYRNKVVRDLDWVLRSPHILNGELEGLPLLKDSWAQNVYSGSRQWLEELDKDPSEMVAWLSEQRGVGRLGFYYAALVEYLLRFCPVLDTKQILCRQQVESADSKHVIGQLKYVILHAPVEEGSSSSSSSASSPEEKERTAERTEEGGETEERERELVCTHLESSIKFFVNVGRHAKGVSLSSLPDAEAGQDTSLGPGGKVQEEGEGGAAEEETDHVVQDGTEREGKRGKGRDSLSGAAAFVGPFLHENLAWRILEARRKLEVCQSGPVQTFLKKKFGVSSVSSRCMLRGVLFHPIETEEKDSQTDTDRDRNRDGETREGTEGCGVQPCSITLDITGGGLISGDHIKGWWTTSVETLTASAHPEARWVVLPKAHWLAPAVAVPVESCTLKGKHIVERQPEADTGVEEESEQLEVPGQAGLPIRSVPVLGVSDFVRFVEDHRRGEKREVPLMVAEMVPARLLEPDPSQGRSEEEGTRRERFRLLERSRGFLLSEEWNPGGLAGEGVAKGKMEGVSRNRSTVERGEGENGIENTGEGVGGNRAGLKIHDGRRLVTSKQQRSRQRMQARVRRPVNLSLALHPNGTQVTGSDAEGKERESEGDGEGEARPSMRRGPYNDLLLPITAPTDSLVPEREQVTGTGLVCRLMAELDQCKNWKFGDVVANLRKQVSATFVRLLPLDRSRAEGAREREGKEKEKEKETDESGPSSREISGGGRESAVGSRRVGRVVVEALEYMSTEGRQSGEVHVLFRPLGHLLLDAFSRLSKDLQELSARRRKRHAGGLAVPLKGGKSKGQKETEIESGLLGEAGEDGSVSEDLFSLCGNSERDAVARLLRDAIVRETRRTSEEEENVQRTAERLRSGWREDTLCLRLLLKAARAVNLQSSDLMQQQQGSVPRSATPPTTAGAEAGSASPSQVDPSAFSHANESPSGLKRPPGVCTSDELSAFLEGQVRLASLLATVGDGDAPPLLSSTDHPEGQTADKRKGEEDGDGPHRGRTAKLLSPAQGPSPCQDSEQQSVSNGVSTHQDPPPPAEWGDGQRERRSPLRRVSSPTGTLAASPGGGACKHKEPKRQSRDCSTEEGTKESDREKIVVRGAQKLAAATEVLSFLDSPVRASDASAMAVTNVLLSLGDPLTLESVLLGFLQSERKGDQRGQEGKKKGKGGGKGKGKDTEKEKEKASGAEKGRELACHAVSSLAEKGQVRTSRKIAKRVGVLSCFPSFIGALDADLALPPLSLPPTINSPPPKQMGPEGSFAHPFRQGSESLPVFNWPALPGRLTVVDSSHRLQKCVVNLKDLIERTGASCDEKGRKDEGGEKLTLKKFVLVGLDCEWRPHDFVKGEEGQSGGKDGAVMQKDSEKSKGGSGNPVSIVQLALPTGDVWIVDLLALLMSPTETAYDGVNRLFNLLFTSCVVVGFGLAVDLQRLRQSYPSVAAFLIEVPRVLDLRLVAHVVLPPSSQKQKGGLSAVCASVLGRRVDKGEQRSDWAQRPLSEAQLEYAALDAFVCLVVSVQMLGGGGGGLLPSVSLFLDTGVETEVLRVLPSLDCPRFFARFLAAGKDQAAAKGRGSQGEQKNRNEGDKAGEEESMLGLQNDEGVLKVEGDEEEEESEAEEGKGELVEGQRDQEGDSSPVARVKRALASACVCVSPSGVASLLHDRDLYRLVCEVPLSLSDFSCISEKCRSGERVEGVLRSDEMEELGKQKGTASLVILLDRQTPRAAADTATTDFICTVSETQNGQGEGECSGTSSPLSRLPSLRGAEGILVKTLAFSLPSEWIAGTENESGRQMGSSEIAMDGGRKVVLCIALVGDRIDARALAEVALRRGNVNGPAGDTRRVPVKKLQLISREELEEVTGFSAGTVGPLGHKTAPALVVLEARAAAASLRTQLPLLCGAGAADLHCPLTVGQLKETCGAQVHAVATATGLPTTC